MYTHRRGAHFTSAHTEAVLRLGLCIYPSSAPFMSLHIPMRRCVYVSAHIDAALRLCFCTYRSGAPFMPLHIRKRCSVYVSAYSEAVLRECFCTYRSGDPFMSPHRCRLVDGYQHVAETCLLYLQGRHIYHSFRSDLLVSQQRGHKFQKKQLPDCWIGRQGCIFFSPRSSMQKNNLSPYS
jgi:hypothetical protein